MTWDSNIVSRSEYRLFRFSFIRHSYPEYFRQRSPAVRQLIPGELTPKYSAEIFQFRYLETKITLAEYDRWVDLINGSQPDLLPMFYRDMVLKYDKQYWHIGLLIYLHDKQNDKGKSKTTGE